MNRASRSELSAALAMAKALAAAGVLFVPVPVLSDEDALEFKAKAYDRLEAMEKAREGDA
jgi:hypothetical protein